MNTGPWTLCSVVLAFAAWGAYSSEGFSPGFALMAGGVVLISLARRVIG